MQLNAKTTEDELQKVFKVFGPVVGCTVMWKTHCAYIDFEEAESATRARRAMNGAFLCGSALRVEFKVSSLLPEVAGSCSAQQQSLAVLLLSGSAALAACVLNMLQL